MITFLSSPKSFTGHTGKIQRLAIQSWQQVCPDAEIILYGSGEGVESACRETGVKHVPEIKCSLAGIPYFNSIVEHAAMNAKNDIQCYLNCDIMLTKAIISAIRVIDFPRYLATGQRIDLSENIYPKSLSNTDILKLLTNGQADLHGPTGMDYFIFPRGMWAGLPPLVIGRCGYDNALVAFCLRNKIPLINTTLAFPALHLFHDYSHVAGGKKTVVNGEDAINNLRWHKLKHSLPDSADAPWLIVENTLMPNAARKDWLRRIELTLRFNMKNEFLALLIRGLWRAGVAAKVIKPDSFTMKDIINSTLKD
jgi:hypothetical protein